MQASRPVAILLGSPTSLFPPLFPFHVPPGQKHNIAPCPNTHPTLRPARIAILPPQNNPGPQEPRDTGRAPTQPLPGNRAPNFSDRGEIVTELARPVTLPGP
jgi:hypothetical protein